MGGHRPAGDEDGTKKALTIAAGAFGLTRYCQGERPTSLSRRYQRPPGASARNSPGGIVPTVYGKVVGQAVVFESVKVIEPVVAGSALLASKNCTV